MAIIISVLCVLVALLAGLAIGYIYRRNVQEKKIGRTEEYARNLLDDAQRRAEEKKKESILEAKEEVIRLKNELDREIRDRRAEVQRSGPGQRFQRGAGDLAPLFAFGEVRQGILARFPQSRKAAGALDGLLQPSRRISRHVAGPME